MKTIYSWIRQHKRLILLAVLLANGAVFFLTNPDQMISPFMVVAYLLIAVDIYIILKAFSRLLRSIGFLANQRRWLTEVVSLFMFVLLAMQSLGQLSLKDVLVLWAFAIAGYGYFRLLQQHYQ